MSNDDAKSEQKEKQFSGQFRLRLPSSLHGELVHRAALEGVSLNQFVCAVLAAELGWTTRREEDSEAREERRQENERLRREKEIKEIYRRAFA